MANKTKNSKLNGKMKRRMRKTTAVVLLITSIVVAAIPVPDVTAAAESDYETNINDKTIDDLYNIYNNLNDKVTINITDIANLTSAINDISKKVNENKTNIDNITQIQNNIATNEEIQNIFNE